MRAPDTSIAVEFLEWLRPDGPWVLSAIVPDGRITTITARTADEVRNFVSKHDGKQNLYYSVNPTRRAMSKKAAKTNIAAVEYLLSDLDPRDDETSEQAKVRYLAQLDDEAFEPKVSGVVDSGNGIQTLWRLAERIELPEPVEVKDVEGKPKLVLSGEAEVVIANIEARVEAMMLRLGSKAGTQNVDRILRMPGTTNLPTKTKIKAGRVPCQTRLIRFNGATCSLDDFPPPPEPGTGKGGRGSGAEPNKPGTPEDGGQHAWQEHGDDEDELEWTIRDCNLPVGQRSGRVWWVINEMLRRGHAPDAIVKVLLERSNGISAHIYDQPKPEEYAKRQVADAKKQSALAIDEDRVPYKTSDNIHIALLKLGITLRYDKFADRVLIEGLPDFGPALDDAAVIRIWLCMDQRFRFRPTKDLLFTIVKDTARLNGFHPVRDYLDGLRWDGVKRIDCWLITYAGAEDTEYIRAVSALILVAAVRRVRQPGCKFDEMCVIEIPIQGTDKSSALRTLAVRDDWFSDNLPLNMESTRVIEALRGKWIVEAAELSGMRKVDHDHLKALLSRQYDRGRLAYDRIVSEVPRQSVLFGTTNAEEYLKDTTGNRRYWPVRCQQFDIDALRRDRDQLWAEAAAREATGASIRLESRLWPAAAEEQAQRQTEEPYVDALRDALGDITWGKISSESLWEILDVKPGMRTQEQSRRVGDAMRKLGWQRPSKSGLVKIGNKPVSGYVKGEPPFRTVTAIRTRDGLQVSQEGDGRP
jgi:hypothetical protein